MCRVNTPTDWAVDKTKIINTPKAKICYSRRACPGFFNTHWNPTYDISSNQDKNFERNSSLFPFNLSIVRAFSVRPWRSSSVVISSRDKDFSYHEVNSCVTGENWLQWQYPIHLQKYKLCKRNMSFHISRIQPCGEAMTQINIIQNMRRGRVKYCASQRAGNDNESLNWKANDVKQWSNKKRATHQLVLEKDDYLLEKKYDRPAENSPGIRIENHIWRGLRWGS